MEFSEIKGVKEESRVSRTNTTKYKFLLSSEKDEPIKSIIVFKFVKFGWLINNIMMNYLNKLRHNVE